VGVPTSSQEGIVELRHSEFNVSSVNRVVLGKTARDLRFNGVFGLVLDREVKKALVDRLEGWELIEFLQIPVDYIIDAFEDEIIENLEDVLEFANLVDLDESNEDSETRE